MLMLDTVTYQNNGKPVPTVLTDTDAALVSWSQKKKLYSVTVLAVNHIG